jgi:hypothetical protein
METTMTSSNNPSSQSAFRLASLRRRTLRAFAAALLVGIGASLSTGTAQADVPGLSAPAKVLYSVENPTQPVSVGFTTTINTSALRLNMNGWVTGATVCTTATGTLPISVVGGVGIVNQPVVSGTALSCALQVTPTAAGPVTVSVEEFDAIGPANTQQRNITFELTTTTFEAADVMVKGAVLVPGEARAPDETISYGIRLLTTGGTGAFVLNGGLLSVQSLAGTTVTCNNNGEAVLWCLVSRTLTQADVLRGTAPMSVDIVQPGGGVLNRYVRDIPVTAEHRIELRMTALPINVAVGETTRITLTATNVGSVPLYDMTTTGDFGGYCNLHTLAAGESFNCSFDRVVTLSEVTAPIKPTVHATSFAPDSDGVSDDATSATDVDATTDTRLNALDPGLTVARLRQPAPIALPLTADATVNATIDLASTRAVRGVKLHFTLPSFISIPGCQTFDNVCVLEVPSTLPAVDVPLTVGIEWAIAGPAGIDLSVPVRVIADGGINLFIGDISLRTFGVSGTLTTGAAPFDAGSLASTTFTATATLAGGPGGELTLVPQPTGSTVSRCTRSGQAVTTTAIADGVSLGALPGAAVVTCTIIVPVGVADAERGAVNASVSFRLLSGGASATATSDASVAAARLTVSPGPTPRVPTHGYSLAGSSDRPNRFTQTFTIAVQGRTPIDHLVVLAGVTCTGDRLPAPTETPASLTCTIEHTVTAAELDSGQAAVSLSALAKAFGGSVTLAGNASVSVPVPKESLSLRMSELSAPPAGSTYTAGDVVRLLVSVYNDGGLPLEVLGVDVGPTTGQPAGSAMRRSDSNLLSAAESSATEVGACLPVQMVVPQSGFECLVTYTVTPFDQAAGHLAFAATVTTSQGITATGQRAVVVAARAVKLPETGTELAGLLALATVLLVVGTLLLGANRRSRR